MTDKERIESTYSKIQTKYPHITNKEEIDNLAIKFDKRNTLLISGAYLLGAIACGIIFFLLIGNETFETTRYIFFVMAGSGVFECFRTLGKYSKIEQRYRPVLKVKYEGMLTKDKVISDGGKMLKKADFAFNVLRLPLFDKEDETDVGIDNNTYHKYYLKFKRPENDLQITYKVNRAFYMDAVLGAEYFVVVTPTNEIVAVYQATNWSLSEDLYPHLTEQPTNNTAQNVAWPTQPLYQANAVTFVQPQKTKKLLPILALIFIVLSYFMPIIVGLPLSIAALVLAVVGIAKQRTKLSIISLVVNICLFLLLIISIVATLTGAI